MNTSDRNFLIDLKYRKLLTEYNAALLAIGSITLGITVLSYNIIQDIFTSVLLGWITYLILSNKKDEIEDKLTSEINKVK